MAEIVWTEPALSDLDAIADFIALENPVAAQKLVRRIFRHVEQLAAHPKSGSKPAELKIGAIGKLSNRHAGSFIVTMILTYLFCT